MKKILFTCYYYDFARFLYEVFDEYKSIEEDSQAKFICFYPSAYHFFNKINDNSIAVKKLYKISSISNNNINVNDNTLNEHYGFTFESINDSSKKIKELSSREYCKIKLFWEKELCNIDIVVSTGDTRPQTTIMLSVAKKLGITIFYLEQGPFNSTIIDKKGVNANVSFKPDFSYSNVSFDKILLQAKPEKYYAELTLTDKFFNYIDWFYMYPPILINSFLPVYTRLEGNLSRKILSKIFKKNNSVENYLDNYVKEKYILLPLQLPTDAQMLCHSGVYSCVEDIVNSVSKVIPDGYKLVIREHPLLIGGYPASVYAIEDNNENIIIDSHSCLDKQLHNADLVIVNNSTTGLDAIIRMKKVVVLGQAYYKYKEICYPVYHRAELEDTINYAISSNLSISNIKSFICSLYESYLFPGHFQDKDLPQAKAIAKYVFDELNEK